MKKIKKTFTIINKYKIIRVLFLLVVLFFNSHNLIQAATFTNTVGSGNDDSYLREGVTFYDTGVTAPLGNSGNDNADHFLLFDNVTIAQGATINTASVSFTLSGSSGVVNVQIKANDVGAAIAPINAAEFIAKATALTTASVDWDSIVSGDWGTIATSPDITTVIQEIINRGDWASGNSILLWFGNNNSDSWSNRIYLTGDFSGGEAKPTLTIDYTETNDPPVGVADSFSTSSNTLLNVLSNDTDPDDDTLSLLSVTDPSHGTASISNGKVSYTPDSGYMGSDSFIYTLSDGNSNTDTATVTVTVVENPIYYTLDFSINNDNVPSLYYQDLTIKIYLGGATATSVTVDGSAVSSSYDESTGNLVFNTNGNVAQIIFKDPTDISAVSVAKAALKDDKSFAWSHGMDDNVNLVTQINLIEAKGWQASVNLIADIIDDTREEEWILDKPDLIPMLNSGWGLGNHTWDHSCSVSNMENSIYMTNTIVNGYNKLAEIVAASNRPTYKLISFAAPCFSSYYDSYITDMRANGPTQVMFNESQGSGLMHIDIGGGGYSSGTISAVAVSSTTEKIGRDTTVESDVGTTLSRLDWMNTNSSSSRHFWFNTLTHGNQEVNLAQVLDRAYDSYGPGGNNKLWFAPSIDIYSYLLVRDNSTLSSNTLTQVADGTTPTTSNLSLSINASNTSADATWDTSKVTSTQVEFGLTSALGASNSLTDTSSYVSSHSSTITSLLPCTQYWYRTKSVAYEATVYSTTDSFMTGGCTNSASVVGSDESVITKDSGGTLEYTFDDSQQSVALNIPTNFSDSDATFQIKQIDKTTTLESTSTPSSYNVVGEHIYDFKSYSDTSTSITSFDNSIDIIMTYDDASVANLDLSSLKIFRWDGSSWGELPNCSIDTSAKTVTCSTTNFSVFGLMGQDSNSSLESSSSSSQNSSSTSSSSKLCSSVSPGLKTPWLYAAVPSGNNSIMLYFTHADDPVDNYMLKFGDKTGEYQYGSISIGGKKIRTYLVDNLASNKKYYFRVGASNGCANGEWSNEISATTNGFFTNDYLQIDNLEVELILNEEKDDEFTQIEAATRIDEEEKDDYIITLSILDKENQPLVGAHVTLHSKVQEAVSDENGEVVFTNVEKGEHRLIVSHENFEGEQSLNLDSEIKEIKLTMQVEQKNGLSLPLAIGIFTLMGIIILFLSLKLKNN